MKLRSWCFEMLLIFGFQSYVEGYKCLNNEDMIVRPRNFYVDENELPIKIEVSSRKTHQLISHIFKILLNEVVGYPQVDLHESDSRELNADRALSTLKKISHCKDPRQCHKTENHVPKIMINLEVWLIPSFNMEGWVATGEVEDCGPLGPIGRSGWFVPAYAVKNLWHNNVSIIDHWRSFKNPELTALFDLSYMKIESFTMNNNLTYCNKECDSDGIYRPYQCRNPNIRCATLLAGYPESFGLLTRQVKELGLLVNIAWVGKNLRSLIEKLVIDKKYVLFFHEKPSLIHSFSQFTHISFPDCEDSPSCKLDIFQLEKIAWSRIKTDAPLIFHLLRSMTFTQDNYTELLNSYNRGVTRGHSAREVACYWIKDNAITWTRWVPDGITDKTRLYIGGIFPSSGVYYKESGVIPAARLAITAVNRNNSLLSEYELDLLEQDGQCLADEVMKSFINYVRNSTYITMVGILGPACTDTVEPIAGLAKHFNTIIISYSAEGSLFSDRAKYPYFFRTIPENNLFRNVYLELFKHLNWRRVAALTEDGQKYPEYVSHLQDLLQNNGMHFIVNRKFPRERTSLNMKPYLEDLRNRKAKIIIGDFYDHAARAVMCDAYKLGMTAAQGYQWFLPLWFTSDWFDTDLHNNIASQPYEHVSCSTEEMIEAINGHMSLAYKFYADDNALMQEGKTVKEWQETYKQLAKVQKKEMSRYGGYAYDAVWLYALALDSLLKENKSHVANLHSSKTSKRLVELINQTTFTGVSGPLQFVGSSRISEVIIWQWIRRTAHEVGVYHPTSEGEGRLELNESKIVWLTYNNQRPNDGSEGESTCPVEGFRQLLNVSCQSAFVIANVIGFSTLVLVTGLGLIFFKRRYDVRMKLTEARMKQLGLMESNGFLTLDEWEMPRDQIVINRKLGEGAFGTVFGGEAFMQAKGWVAVAVKTLKIGAKPEEKLDFLGEAEIMKKFDHVNIVKLIGVCTMGEPVYTVMEFMLYGDLKTFLLGRRNLVTEDDCAKSDEVSDRRLTNMALDIARGLSYLADLKFVHRDLACRNCLVTACRSVKIGDFGMCRAMYDSDYYRFNKKGMLPVRWMAPESLTDGIFTPMSDVWSYGVLLYEIVTFGSFPYQGLSNNQVLEYVKNYNTLSVPKGCKIELEQLLKKCWSRNAQDRPHAVDIVEILVNQPELISPCLDMPMASVEVEDSHSLELTIHDRSRIQSVSSIWSQRRHRSVPDDTLNGFAEVPHILITENGNLTPPSEIKPFFLNNNKKISDHYNNLPQKNAKKDGKEPKFERSVPPDIYQITHL